MNGGGMDVQISSTIQRRAWLDPETCLRAKKIFSILTELVVLQSKWNYDGAGLGWSLRWKSLIRGPLPLPTSTQHIEIDNSSIKIVNKLST